MTFVGACTQQTCFLTSGEQDLWARASLLIYYNAVPSHILPLSTKNKNAASCDLDVALGHNEILVIFRLIVEHELNDKNCQMSLWALGNSKAHFSNQSHPKIISRLIDDGTNSSFQPKLIVSNWVKE